MAAFGDLSNILGYDIMSPMYKQITGSDKDPFSMDLGEGNNWLLGAKQGQTLGQFDPSVFNGIDFNWQGGGPGNSGTLSATRDGQSLGSWSQYDTPFGETMLDALMTAGAAFGGLGLAGAGPWSGLADLFGGGAAAAGGAGEAAAGGFAAEAAIPTAAELGALEGGSLLAGGAGIGGTLPAGMAGFAAPAEIGMLSGAAGAGSLLGDVSQYMMTPEQFANIDGGTALGGGLMGGGVPAGTAKAAGGLSAYLDKLLTPAGANAAIPSLVQMYSGITQRNQANKLMGQLTGLGKAGGPYEQALRKQLERRDAAAGRRSQYGPREVELQAKLAELLTKNSGTLAQLMGQSMGGTNQMLQGGLFGGKKLLDLFGG